MKIERFLAPEMVITKLTGSTFKLVFKSQCRVELQIGNGNCECCVCPNVTPLLILCMQMFLPSIELQCIFFSI